MTTPAHASGHLAAPRPIPWALILGTWTTYGLFSSATSFISSAMRGSPLQWWAALLLQMPQFGIWALATPGILWLGRRFPFERGTWPRSVAVHVAVCCTFVFLQDLGYAWHVANVLPPWPNMRPLLTRAVQLFVVWILSDGALYWAVLAVSYVVEHQRRLRERELAASQLETQLAQADLHALKMQLHPHFLFNALHTIGALVRTGDQETAVRVVAGLGDLLRRMLDGASQQEVALRQELDFVRTYLAIEQIRFRDRLTVAITADDDVADARVPHLILQPLVENAIRHGIAPHARAGRVTVCARRLGDRLHLIVRDDGPGIGNGERVTAQPGIGLSNVQARLTKLYGDDFSLEVCDAVDGGLEARVTVPFRLAPADRERER
jgi:two-component system LytT family sensor kinase